MKVRVWAAMLLGLTVTGAPLLAAMILAFTGRLPPPGATPDDSALLGIVLIGFVIAFAAGCIVSLMARAPLGPLDYGLAAGLAAVISGNRLLGAPDPVQTILFFALTFGAALAGALLAEWARKLG